MKKKKNSYYFSDHSIRYRVVNNPDGTLTMYAVDVIDQDGNKNALMYDYLKHVLCDTFDIIKQSKGSNVCIFNNVTTEADVRRKIIEIESKIKKAILVEDD